jgi:hypothetical protein
MNKSITLRGSTSYRRLSLLEAKRKEYTDREGRNYKDNFFEGNI